MNCNTGRGRDSEDTKRRDNESLVMILTDTAYREMQTGYPLDICQRSAKSTPYVHMAEFQKSTDQNRRTTHVSSPHTHRADWFEQACRPGSKRQNTADVLGYKMQRPQSVLIDAAAEWLPA